MKTALIHSLLACTVLAVAARGADADNANWPAWRGPLANGSAPLADPPTEWSETKNIRWKVAIPGEGTATPVIWGDKVFILTAAPTGKKPEPKVAEAGAKDLAKADAPPPPPPGKRGPGGPGGRPGGGGMSMQPTEVLQFTVLCLNRATGKVLWQRVAREELPHEGRHPTGSYAAGSPVTDGRLVFAYFGSRGLYCYDLDGKLQWEKDFGKMRIRVGFGEGASPALHGDKLIVNWDHEGGSFIAVLDKRTGKELWRKTRDEQTNWTTPLVVEHDGKPQVVTSATSKVRSYDLGTGDLVWECTGQSANTIPTPVNGFGMVYCMSGFRSYALQAIRLGKSGNLTGTDSIAWSLAKNTPYVPSPLLSGDRLYFYSGNNGVLSCFDAKAGTAHFETERVEGMRNVYASPVSAKGRVYLASREGLVVVIKDAARFEVLASNKLDEGIDASPAAVGRELFLRGKQSLYCIAEK